MKGKFRKISIILLVLVVSHLLTGYSLLFSNVELKSDEPLIDLEKLFVDSPSGKYGNPEEGLSGKTEDQLISGEDTKQAEIALEMEETAVTEVPSEICVEIYGKDITVDGNPVHNVEAMLEIVRGRNVDGNELSVLLVDNYAEYKTYLEAVEKLKLISPQVVIAEETK